MYSWLSHYTGRSNLRYIKMPVGKKKPKKIYMPGDLGDATTRRNYRKSGPVITYKYVEAFNDMGNAISLNEFLQLPDTQAKDIMLELSKMSDQELALEWNVQTSFIRKIRHILGIKKDHSGSIVSNTDILSDKWPPVYRPRKRVCTAVVEKNIEHAEIQMSVPIQCADEKEINGFYFSLEGIFPAGEIQKRIEALALMASCSPQSKFSVKIILEEVPSEEVNNNLSMLALNNSEI